MFYDFSSAFNTIQPHLLADKLLKMNVSPSTVLWVLDYLTNRPQFVRLQSGCNSSLSQNTASSCVSSTNPSTKMKKQSDLMSDVIFTNTGAPQGTVLSPFLFSLYTADCRASHDNCLIDKYADDTALTGQITNDNDANYRQEIVDFVDWCDKNYLQLNVNKTKEMVIDFRKNKVAPSPVIIKGGRGRMSTNV